MTSWFGRPRRGLKERHIVLASLAQRTSKSEAEVSRLTMGGGWTNPPGRLCLSRVATCLDRLAGWRAAAGVALGSVGHRPGREAPGQSRGRRLLRADPHDADHADEMTVGTLPALPRKSYLFYAVPG